MKVTAAVLIGLVLALTTVHAQLEAPITVAPITGEKTITVVEETQPVAIRIRRIEIMFRPDGKAFVMTHWEWVDADGVVVKRGIDRKTEEQLVAAGVDVAALKALFAGVAKAGAEAP